MTCPGGPDLRYGRGLAPRWWPFPRLAEVAAVLGVASVPLLASLMGTAGPSSATIKLGPNTGSYLSGFHRSYEIEDLLATRWTTYEAGIDLPLTVRGGPVDLSYRFARVFPQTAVVEVFLAGTLVDHFTCRGGTFIVRRVRMASVPQTPVQLAFKVDSHERRNLGLKLDWVRVGVQRGGRLAGRGPAAWLAGGLAAILYLLSRWMGHSATRALLIAAPVSLAAAAWAWLDPFGFAHVALKIALPAAILSAAVAALLRRVSGGCWVLPIFAAGYLLKGAGLFHPSSFYPDVQNARRYIVALRDASGSIAERGLQAQLETNVAYPRFVRGRPYAFPYSPLFFLPFGALENPDRIEDAFRQAGLAAAALEVLPVFALARLAAPGGAGTAIIAALLSAVQPPLYSRLLLAMTVTLAGHLLDAWLVAATLASVLRPASRTWKVAVAVAAAASMLTYVSSLFTAGSFLLAMSVLERRHARLFLSILGGSLLLSVTWLYAPFAWRFATEILPALVTPATSVAAARPGPAAVATALGRIPLFYGPVYPVLAVAGLVLLRRRGEERALRVLAAHALAFALLVALRAFGGGLFRDLKEITFAAPLVSVLASLALTELSRKGRGGRVATTLIILGLIAFGMARYHGYLMAYASPFLAVRGAT